MATRGKVMVSLIWDELVRRAVRRSMPQPQPAVGGSPYSRARQYSSSGSMASGSVLLAWLARAARWASGSFSSV